MLFCIETKAEMNLERKHDAFVFYEVHYHVTKSVFLLKLIIFKAIF